MIDRQRGTIINISSLSGKRVVPDLVGYAASKFAVSASDGVRQEVAEFGIRVMSICPGIVETPMIARLELEVLQARDM